MEEKLYIDIKYISDASEIISTASTNINSNITNINKILDASIKENWDGPDSASYIQGFKNIMTLLESYNAELGKIGEYLDSISIDYDNVKNTTLKEITENE